MSKPILAALGTGAAAALVLAFAQPAGTASPHVIRHVRIGAFAGPAYYSVVDGGFRAIRGAVTVAASSDAAPEAAGTGIAETSRAN